MPSNRLVQYPMRLSLFAPIIPDRIISPGCWLPPPKVLLSTKRRNLPSEDPTNYSNESAEKCWLTFRTQLWMRIRRPPQSVHAANLTELSASSGLCGEREILAPKGIVIASTAKQPRGGRAPIHRDMLRRSAPGNDRSNLISQTPRSEH
jgi:hypothetical protein